MSCDFQTTTHGKWILVGEHAVLRGHPALVFPIHDKKLTLQYYKSTSPLSIEILGDQNTGISDLFWKVLVHGMQLLSRRAGACLETQALLGHIVLQSNIPIGVGMGASAALCVAISRWFVTQDLIPSQDTLTFAQELEHLFHGQSSGLDIAGSAANGGIYFQQGKTIPIQQTWEPNWSLSYCGEIGMTSPCIKQVQLLWQSNSAQAARIDQQMHQSVVEAKTALKINEPKSLHNLAEAINKAMDCFQQWGLISKPLQQHMQSLLNKGALAVKPTGSGGGGYVVSLWEKPPLNSQLAI